MGISSKQAGSGAMDAPRRFTRALLSDAHEDYRFVVPRRAVKAYSSRCCDDTIDIAVFVRRGLDPRLAICMDAHEVLWLNTARGKAPVLCGRVLSVTHARTGRRADIELEPMW